MGWFGSKKNKGRGGSSYSGFCDPKKNEEGNGREHRDEHRDEHRVANGKEHESRKMMDQPKGTVVKRESRPHLIIEAAQVELSSPV